MLHISNQISIFHREGKPLGILLEGGRGAGAGTALTPVRGIHQIKSRQFKDCVTHNIIDSQSTTNSRCFKNVQCKTELFRNSFFPQNNY